MVQLRVDINCNGIHCGNCKFRTFKATACYLWNVSLREEGDGVERCDDCLFAEAMRTEEDWTKILRNIESIAHDALNDAEVNEPCP